MEAMSGPTRTKEQKAANEAAIIKLRKMKENKFAIGSRLGKGAFNHWLVEQLSGLNVNSGNTILCQIDIHASPRFIQTNLE
jgi:hypothetical protein